MEPVGKYFASPVGATQDADARGQGRPCLDLRPDSRKAAVSNGSGHGGGRRMAAYKFIGQPIPRIEDAALLTGAGRFVDDVPVPEALEAAFVRSAFAHARIRSMDVAAARA